MAFKVFQTRSAIDQREHQHGEGRVKGTISNDTAKNPLSTKTHVYIKGKMLIPAMNSNLLDMGELIFQGAQANHDGEGDGNVTKQKVQ